jgi:hypothetical protein
VAEAAHVELRLAHVVRVGLVVVDEPAAAALLGQALSERHPDRPVVLEEVLQVVAVEQRLLELGDVLHVVVVDIGALRVPEDGVARLLLEVRRAAVIHEHRIERRCVHRGRDAARQDHLARARPDDPHVGRQRDRDEHRRISLDPVERVAADGVGRVVPEERIVRAPSGQILDVPRRQRSRIVAIRWMAGRARAAVAPECLVLEQILSSTPSVPPTSSDLVQLASVVGVPVRRASGRGKRGRQQH